MEINDFKAWGLPMLLAQKRLREINFRKVQKSLHYHKSLFSINLAFANAPGEMEVKFTYPGEEQIPVEFVIAFEQLANRLISEKWMIEAAIEELESEKLQSDLLALFNPGNVR
jgi:hypothetical protein